jgi:hypothetical protein
MSASSEAGLVITEDTIKGLVDFYINTRETSRKAYAEKKGSLTEADSKFIDDGIITLMTPIKLFDDKQYPTTLYNGLLEKLNGDESLKYLVDEYRKKILSKSVGGRRRKTRRHRNKRRQSHRNRQIFRPVSATF